MVLRQQPNFRRIPSNEWAEVQRRKISDSYQLEYQPRMPAFLLKVRSWYNQISAKDTRYPASSAIFTNSLSLFAMLILWRNL